MNSYLSEPAPQLEEFLPEARWSDCGDRVSLKCVGLVVKSQKRNRIAKFDVAWSYNTAESQHAKGLPFLSSARSINLKLMKQHAVTSVLMSQKLKPRCRSQVHRMLLKSVSRLRGWPHCRQRTNTLESSAVPEARRRSWYVFPPQKGHALP